MTNVQKTGMLIIVGVLSLISCVLGLVNQSLMKDYITIRDENSTLKHEFSLYQSETTNKQLMDVLHKKAQEQVIKKITFNWIKENAKESVSDDDINKIIDEVTRYKNWELLVAIMSVESHFDRFAMSSANARGLMQVMHSVWSDELDIDDPQDMFKIENSIYYGNHVINTYLDACNNNVSDALRKYVGGDSNYAKKVLSKYARLHIRIMIRLDEIANEGLPVSDELVEDEVVNTVVSLIN